MQEDFTISLIYIFSFFLLYYGINSNSAFLSGPDVIVIKITTVCPGSIDPFNEVT